MIKTTKNVSFAIDKQDACEHIYHEENIKNKDFEESLPKFRLCICGKKICTNCLISHQLYSKFHKCQSKNHNQTITVARKCICGKNICSLCYDLHIINDPEHNSCESVFHNYSVLSLINICECGKNICENCKDIHLLTFSFHTNKINNETINETKN